MELLRIATGHSRNIIQYGGILAWVHLAKIKVHFLINKVASLYNSNKYLLLGICCRIYARQKFPLMMPSRLTVLSHYLEFLVGVNPTTQSVFISIFETNLSHGIV